MKIKFSRHALERLKERDIKQKDVESFIKHPDKIEISEVNKNKFLIKKIYRNQKYNKDHLLMIVCKKENNILMIITIIDTSKISKYI